jgi:hypothetical protein
MRRTVAYAVMTKEEAQRHLKVINSIRTFYEAVIYGLQILSGLRK